MTRTVGAALALRICWVLVIVVLSGGCAQEDVEPTPDAGGHHLLVLPESFQDTQLATISGALGLNARDCFTLDGFLLLTAHGSRVLPGGEGIEIPGIGAVALGERIDGGAGGYVTDRGTLDLLLEETGLRRDAEACGAGTRVARSGMVMLRAG